MMRFKAKTIKDYIAEVPAEKKPYFIKLRQTILQNIPKEFIEEMSYSMIGYVVPHTIFPEGYHCNPKLPLPFVNIACQKNFIALYHMSIYADKELLNWIITQYPKHCKYKLDMGKSCIRFKKIESIPYNLIGELMQKISVQDWIKTYNLSIKKS